ncbi:hypothetical protein HMN09_00199800 [Mycena chlorophos]|uniref:Uncharacterized protein n=1 Tax=Mycena chlorophos TaxID=658473 RepID=A0A8H6WJP8_MYCCL|nr:hypothetical protein HMN09_00199800 [Mycena chlorophos]
MLSSSPERIQRRDTSMSLERVPEADEPAYEEWNDDEDLLEEQGLYRGSYNRLVLLYTLAPLTTVIVLALSAALPFIVYHYHDAENDYPYSVFLPYPLPEILIPAALFIFTHCLRPVLFTLPTLVVPESFATTLVSTALSTILTIVGRMVALILLLIRPYAAYDTPTWHDPAFVRIWWAGLGWAAAEGIVAVAQGYAGLELYRDVLVPSSTATPRAATPDSTEHQPSSSTERTPLLPRLSSGSTIPIPKPLDASVVLTDPGTELDNDLDQLLALKARDDLEDVLGIPLVYIPPFIPPLQRVNAVLLSLGLFLLLGAALFVSRLAATSLVGVAAAAHVLLSALHAPGVLPRVGLPSAAFVGAVVSLGVLFAGLGVWGGVS